MGRLKRSFYLLISEAIYLDIVNFIVYIGAGLDHMTVIGKYCFSKFYFYMGEKFIFHSTVDIVAQSVH